MPAHIGRDNSRDFAFQSTDQSPAAHQRGGEEGAQQAFSFQRHETLPHANGPLAPTTPTQSSLLPPSLNYQDFATHHGSALPSEAAPQLLPGHALHPGEPSAWDWGSAIDFTNFTNHYEPQGELVQELQTQHHQQPTADFSIPLPVSTNPAPISPTHPAVVQNPLSPPPKPSRRLSVSTSMKRKADSELNSGIAQVNASADDRSTKRPQTSRTSSMASPISPVATTSVTPDLRPPTSLTASMTAPANLESTSQSGFEPPAKRKEPSKGTGPQGRVIDVSIPRRVVESQSSTEILPSGKVFPIQIGSELFRLSGASISSDAPSYFSHFFGEQIHSNQGRAGDVKTLYIDRDPNTFRDIALHLQGYHVNPRDGEHFVRLFADAQFYSLPRLTKQLFSTDIFIRIGGTPFQIPRDLFSSPGDSPNYFSLGFAQFFSTPSEVFPGLDRNALLRPPSISPPVVPNRNGETFGELVKMLQGYEVDIRNNAHRSQLLRDARYFHLKGLEQKLIPCEISYNMRRGQSEILIRLDDIRQSGVSFYPDTLSSSSDSGSGSAAASQLGGSPSSPSKQASETSSLNISSYKAGTVSYARPYTDDHANRNILILELSTNESTTLHLPIDPPTQMSTSEPLTLDARATFHGSTLSRITSLFSVIASKMGLPATQPLGLMMLQSGGGVAAQPVSPANSGVSERRVRVRIGSDCDLEIDNSPAELAIDSETGRLGIRGVQDEPHSKRSRMSGEDGPISREWFWGGPRESEVAIKDGEELEEKLIVKRAHWRIRVENVDGDVQKMMVVLCGVRVEAFSGERGRNHSRGFLG